MEIIDFFKYGQQRALIPKIARGDWPPCQLLAELLESGRFQEATKGGTVYLLMDGENIVSFLTFSRQDCVIDEKLYPWAGFVYTFPEYRGHRYVGTLLAHAEDTARSHGCETVYIATDHIGLYEKYGYTYWESRTDMYQEECRIYIKKIGETV